MELIAVVLTSLEDGNPAQECNHEPACEEENERPRK